MGIALSLSGFFLTVLKFSNIKLVYKKVEKIQVVSFRRIICDNFQNTLKENTVQQSEKKKKIQLVYFDKNL